MIRGYIRVSTKKQELGTSLDDQRATLTAEGCQEIYEDVYTGTALERPEFVRLCSEVEPFPKKRTVKTEKKRNEIIEMRDREIKRRRYREKLQSVWETASREQNGDAQSCRRPPGRQIRRSVPRRGYGNA